MKKPQRGWTLVEGMVSLAVSAIALATAVPGFEAARERRHLDGAAAQLETDLQLARSLAVAQNRTLRFSFASNAAGSCYMVHSGSASDCHCDATGAASCSGAAQVLRSAGYSAKLPFKLSSNSASMAFEHIRGTVTPTSTVKIVGREQAVHVITNIMGRVRACSPTSASFGYPAC